MNKAGGLFKFLLKLTNGFMVFCVCDLEMYL